ncbi:transglutaminase-like domain-containing protein [Labedella endophytica]|uniref:transglutaminase-like domain-containing protein n=1 Tax=Labedella endophytica TaxID=1523160 RepID=UPI001FB806F6|nr:transglutaminase family protein [Labedella endophytica]
MQRRATAHLRITAQSSVRLALIVAAAQGQRITERLDVRRDGSPLDPRELFATHGTRLHVIDTDAATIEIDYDVEVTGLAEPAPIDDVDLLTYVRPSRYCESDTLSPTARAEFAGLSGLDLLAGVSSWVGSELRYVPGSSGPTDGATQTLLARQGVCRDYAHLVIALLRALDVPARLAAVYAPGLSPMDFHAVAEAYVDGAWHVVDATTLAPRQTLVRIATGRDAADTAFLGTYHGFATLDEVSVTATSDELPRDDVRELAELR